MFFILESVFCFTGCLLLQPSAIETDSEEYRSHNDTESDLEVEKGVVVIQDLETIQVHLYLHFQIAFSFLNLNYVHKAI